jgi:hypothetical protein
MRWVGRDLVDRLPQSRASLVGVSRSRARDLGPSFPEAARAYRGLTPFSMLFSHVVMKESGAAALNVLVPSVRRRDTFAGVMTALTFGRELAARTGRRARVVVTNRGGVPARARGRYVSSAMGGAV